MDQDWACREVEDGWANEWLKSLDHKWETGVARIVKAARGQ